jgi:predicted kinase
MSRGKLFATVGLPRSGKSTYADDWVRGDIAGKRGDEYDVFEVRKIDRPRVIIAGDDFRTALHGQPYLLEAEAAVFAMMDVAARALLARGFDVIIDETCTTEDTLSRYLRLDLDFTPVFIDTPLDVCIQRALDVGRHLLVEPMKNMARQLADLRPRWDEARARLTERLRRRYPFAFPTPEAA